MTTVGYGDMVPQTPIGKILSGLTAIWGIILIALPVAIVGSNFSTVYYETKKEIEIIKKHKQFSKQRF